MALFFLDLFILVGGWGIAQWVFQGYEAHVPLGKRLTKLVVVAGVLLGARHFAGRGIFYGVLLLMSAGIGVLHGYWFHYKHGIHWRKAEPRDKYLKLIGKG